jgi:ABC-type multidrug transport system fused ATPase/permease subunit
LEKHKGGAGIIWFFLRPYRLQLTMLLALSLLIGGLEAGSVAAVYPILTTAFTSGAGPSNFVLDMFGALAGLLPISDRFITYCIFFLVLSMLAFAVKMLSVNFRTKFGVDLVEKNQNEVFRQFMRADYQYFVDHKQGDLIYNAISAPLAIASQIGAITNLVTQGILSISVMVLLFSLSWRGTLVVLVIGAVYYLFNRYLGNKVAYTSGMGEMQSAQEGLVILNEAITGIKQVKVLVAAETWIDRFTGSMKRRWYYFLRRSIWQQVPPPILTLVMYLSVGLVAVFMKLLAPAASFTESIPLFGTFAFAVFRLAPLATSLGDMVMQIMGSLPNCEIVYKIRNENLTGIEDGPKEFTAFNSAIAFDDVTFTYKGRTRTIQDVTATFEKGKTTAIVGRSGEGKTTFINLILRLFDVDRGAIRIDGVDIREYRLGSWLANIGYVSQDTFVFNDTIEHNITFRSEKYRHEDVIRAARYADAHEFITGLPEGYETLVGDKGVKLSGGQAQRIAVARAIIRNPEIFIFDEATNNLDNISEKVVQKAIDEISRGHTAIIIAHRLSTIVNADKILVLENGRLAEQGTHEQLLEKKGAYWALYQKHVT